MLPCKFGGTPVFWNPVPGLAGQCSMPRMAADPGCHNFDVIKKSIAIECVRAHTHKIKKYRDHKKQAGWLVLAGMCGELWHGQAKNGVNLAFQVKFDLDGRGESPPKQ